MLKSPLVQICAYQRIPNDSCEKYDYVDRYQDHLIGVYTDPTLVQRVVAFAQAKFIQTERTI